MTQEGESIVKKVVRYKVEATVEAVIDGDAPPEAAVESLAWSALGCIGPDGDFNEYHDDANKLGSVLSMTIKKVKVKEKS